MREDRTRRSKVEVELERFKAAQAQDKVRLLTARLKVIQYGVVGSCAYFAIRLFAQNSILVGWAVSLSCAAAVLSRVCLHRGQLSLSRMSMMLGIATAVWLPVLGAGMMDAGGVWTFPVVAMVASCLFDRKGTLVWCLLSGVVLSLIFLGDLLGWSPAITHTILPSEVLGVKLTVLTIYCVVSFMTTSAHGRQLRLLEQQREKATAQHHRAQQANQAKSQFLTRMSHEIRTPMNGLLGATAHLREQELTPEERHAVESVNRCSSNLLSLLNDALDLKKIEMGQCGFEIAPTDLCLLLRDVRALFLARAELVEIDLVAELPCDAYWVQTDGSRIRQIVSNLIGNALKFSDRGSIFIRLRVAEPKGPRSEYDEVEIEVQDQGIGMDEDQVSRLFQDFEQVHTETETLRGGTGLGLSISKTLVEGLGGRLSVFSERGVGSTFRMCIPMKKAASPPERDDILSKSNAQPGMGLKRGLVALVVDDNQINLKVAVLALRKLGIECQTANHGKQAVQLAQGQAFDLIFMDIQMPLMDGIEASRRIKASGGLNARTPIVALTANAYPQDRRRAEDAGMVGYVVKPFEVEQLEAESIRVLQLAGQDKTRSLPGTPAAKTPGMVDPAAQDASLARAASGYSPKQRISDRVYHDRLKLLIRLAIVGGGGYTLMYIYNECWRLMICDGLAMGLYVLSEIFRRRTGSARWARDLFLFGLLLSLVGNPTFGGQADSYVPWLFGMLPIAAGHLKGKGAIVGWGVVTFLAILCLQFVAPSLGLTQEFFPTPRDRTITIFISLLVFSSLAWASCVATEEQMRACMRASIDLFNKREAVDSANTAKSSFLANMSHELRTPMNGVLGMLEYLSLRQLSAHNRELVETAQASGQRLLDTLNRILDYSKMEAGKFSLNSLEFDGNEVLDSLHEEFKLAAKAKGLLFDVRRAEIPCSLDGDRERFRQIVSIVLNNAVRYSDKGTILLDVEAQQRNSSQVQLTMRVTDEGSGIPASVRESVFSGSDRSGDADDSGGGIGFGLVLARRLAEMMDGSVELESSSLSGSVICIRVRLKAVTKGCGAQENAARAEQSASFGATILVVDDREINRKVVGLQLQRLGCTVQAVECGHRAIEVARQRKFDLVLMDLDMPGMGGEQAARAILQSRGPNADTPIVAFTGHASGQSLESALAAGMTDRLIKPASAKDIERVLRENLLPRSIAA